VVLAPEVNPVREPDALVAHVRFDERGKETEHGLRLFGTGGTKGPATESPWPKPPRLSSTLHPKSSSSRPGSHEGYKIKRTDSNTGLPDKYYYYNNVWQCVEERKVSDGSVVYW